MRKGKEPTRRRYLGNNTAFFCLFASDWHAEAGVINHIFEPTTKVEKPTISLPGVLMSGG